MGIPLPPRGARRHRQHIAPAGAIAGRAALASSQFWRRALAVLALAAAAFLAYLPVLSCNFINYDDGVLIANNPHVRGGLTLGNLQWAWTTLSIGYPQPVTLTSFMIDAELYGVGHPGGFHATNLIIHMGNVLLLCLLLCRATGSFWRSLLVSALFAVHPLQVESVAWVTERKGLLGMFFALLAGLAYLRYARNIPQAARNSANGADGKATGPASRITSGESHVVGKPPGSAGDVAPAQSARDLLIWRSAMSFLMLVLLAVSLMSKPVFVVFPLLLLIVDFWPLQRFRTISRRHLAGQQPFRPATPTVLILEKLPLLAVVTGAIGLGLEGQRRIGSVVGTAHSPLSTRLAGATVVYGRSLAKVFDCARLALPYIEPRAWPAGQVIVAASVLLGFTALALWQARGRPWLIVGWLGFLTLLGPVTGIMPFGGHLFADRYTYSAIVALGIMAAWSIPTRFVAPGRARSAVAIMSAGLLAACSFLTFHQARFWRNSFTLFAHTLTVTGDNAVADTLLGNASLRRGNPGDIQQALDYCTRALRLEPDNPSANLNAAIALLRLGRPDEAVPHLQNVIAFNPATRDGLTALHALGNVWIARGDVPAAIAVYRRALEIAPDFAEARASLGMAYGMQGNLDASIGELARSLDDDPQLPDAYRYLGTALLQRGQVGPAVDCFQKALALKGDSPEAWYGLGNAYDAAGKPNRAIEAYRGALSLRPDYAAAQQKLRIAKMRESGLR